MTRNPLPPCAVPPCAVLQHRTIAAVAIERTVKGGGVRKHTHTQAQGRRGAVVRGLQFRDTGCCCDPLAGVPYLCSRTTQANAAMIHAANMDLQHDGP